MLYSRTLYNRHIWGINFGHYTEVAFAEGFCTQTVHLGSGLYITVGLSSVVAIKRGSTVVDIDLTLCL